MGCVYFLRFFIGFGVAFIFDLYVSGDVGRGGFCIFFSDNDGVGWG